MKSMKLALMVLLLGMATSASAKLIQIIHTNDLHSFFEGPRSGKGGYARLKSLVEQLKKEAANKGIKTIFLDAGDFGEGSSFYFSQKGLDSLRALDLLGVDATVLGNHDFMTGANDLERQMKDSKLKAHVLSANLKTQKKKTSLKNHIKPFVDLDIDGMKIRIFGLTTAELHFQYPLLGQGFIGKAINKGVQIAAKSPEENVDLLIGLTHIGLAKDTTLIQQTRNIDLIVGGHSHTRLEQPKMVENLNKELIPIVQAGAHGIAVGSMILDLHGKGDYTLIDYRLHDVNMDLVEDPDMKTFVREAYSHRQNYFNRIWTDVIGFSEIKLTGLDAGENRDSRSCWSQHIARLTREIAKTDIGIQFDMFQGEEIQAGPIKFGDLIDNFPHFRDWGDKGWNITKAKMSGVFVKKFIKIVADVDNKYAATMDGLQAWDKNTNRLVTFKAGVHTLEDARINGEKVQAFRRYTIAIPTEVSFALGKTFRVFKTIIMRKSEVVEGSNYWPLFEGYVARNSPLKCLAD